MADTKEVVKVLPFGARVRLSKVDMNGYTGRDLHPDENDVGFMGVVIKNHFFSWGDQMTIGRTAEDVAPGTILRQDDDVLENPDATFEEVMYEVLGPDGRKLECMWFELEAIGSIVS
jgi:hypothetical protein